MNWDYTYDHIGDNPAAKAKTPGALYQQILYLQKLLRAAGFPDGLINTYAMAQIMFETNDLSSDLTQNGNNFSGIKFINKPYQKNAHALPNGYAGFTTDQDWANDYYRVLSLSPGKPVNATSLQDFFNRLIANKYFEAVPATYSAGLNTWIKKINDAITQANAAGAQAQSTGTATSGDWNAADTANVDMQQVFTKLKDGWNGLPLPGKIGVGLAAVILAVKLFED